MVHNRIKTTLDESVMKISAGMEAWFGSDGADFSVNKRNIFMQIFERLLHRVHLGFGLCAFLCPSGHEKRLDITNGIRWVR